MTISTRVLLAGLALAVALGTCLPQGVVAAPTASLDPESVVEIVLWEGPGARAAWLSLLGSLLEAADLQHQHQLGPPRAGSVTLPGPEGPVTISLGGPTRLERARIEELLPLQFEMVREVALITYAREMSTLRAAAVGAFYDALLAEEALRLHHGALEMFRAHHERARALFDRGMVAEIDVINAEARVFLAEADLHGARVRLGRTHMRLRELMGVAPDAPLVIDGSLEYAPIIDADPAADIAQALSVSPEVVSAAGAVLLAEKELELFIGNHGGFSRRRAYRERTLAIEEAEHALQGVEREVQGEIRAVHDELSHLERRVEALTRHSQLMQRAADVAVLRYEAGLTTLIEVLDSTHGLHQAELAYMEGVVEHLVLRTRLESLLGLGVPWIDERIEEALGEIRDLH